MLQYMNSIYYSCTILHHFSKFLPCQTITQSLWIKNNPPLFSFFIFFSFGIKKISSAASLRLEWLVGLKLFSCPQQTLCLQYLCWTNTSEEFSQRGGDGRAILSPLSSHRAQSQAIPQQKARENYGQYRILDDNSPSFPGCMVALKNSVSVFIWWSLSIMCSSLGFYTVRAWHTLWPCASLGAMQVTLIYSSSLPPSSLETAWECF